MRREIKETVDSTTQHLSEKMYDAILRGKVPDLNTLISQEVCSILILIFLCYLVDFFPSF